MKVATLRAGRVRAAMLRFCMCERAEGADRQRDGTAVRDVAQFPAFLALGVSGGGEHLFHSPISGEEVEQREEGESVRRGH